MLPEIYLFLIYAFQRDGVILGGVLTQKNQSLHQNRQIGIGFFDFLKFPNWHWFFLVFFVFFLVFFLVFLALVLARIRNWKLIFLGFFGFFWFFWLKLWPTFEIGNRFLGFFGFFWHLILGLECHPKKTKKYKKKKPKKTKKTQKKTKKTSRYTKIGKLAWFFFGFFWGEHPPPPF